MSAATAGALIGAGLFLLLAWARLRPTLAEQLHRLERVGNPPGPSKVVGVRGPWTGNGPGDRTGPGDQTGPTSVSRRLILGVAALELALRERVGALSGRVTDSSIRADLDLLGVDKQTHTARQAVLAIAALVLTPLPLLLLATVTGLPWLTAGWLVLIAVAGAVIVPNLRVKARAARLRRTFVSTLSSYLDLVSMRVASGSGVAEALRDASQIGDGYGWRRLRDALSSARLAGDSPATGLGQLGVDIAVPELTDLASQLSLVEATGAQTEATLRAKAEALRERQRLEMHGDANARSQTLVLGQILLGVAYMILVGYPALAAVMSL